MNTIIGSIKRHPLVIFFALAYALSWWPAMLEPHGIFPLGPLVAALVVLPFVGGRSAVIDFLRRIARWRVAPRWYVLALGLPAVLMGAGVGLNVLLGAKAPTIERMPPLANLPLIFLSILLYIGLGEEPAWRGFALPRLMAGRTALAGALLLGVLHALWHLPLFGLEYDWQNGVPWTIGVLGFAIVTAWVYNRTQGNLLLPILLHTSNNTAAKYLFNPLFSGTDLIQLWWMFGLAWFSAALVVVLLAGPNLGRQPAAQAEAIAAPIVVS